MSLIPWRNKRAESNVTRPETSLSRLRWEMDHLFDRFLRDPWGMELFDRVGSDLAWGPQIELKESENEVTLKAELPGVEPEDVDVNVSGNVLTLRGEKRREHEEKKSDYYYMERQYGSFHRSIQLPNSVDPDKVDATFKKGVLTVTLAKRPDARPNRVKVRAD